MRKASTSFGQAAIPRELSEQRELPLRVSPKVNGRGLNGHSGPLLRRSSDEAPTIGDQLSERQASPLAYSKKLPKPKTIYVLDFFCGCGGMSWGFTNTRQSHVAFEVVAGIDIDAHALATYRKNLPNSRAIRQDIRHLAARDGALAEALNLPNLAQMRPLVFVGCPPCQGFSAHRKKDSRDDPRNDLSIAFALLCREYRPDAFVIENVPEMLKGRFAQYFDDAESILGSAGYCLSKSILDLSRYGIPQRRMRALVIGSLGSPIPAPPAPLDESNARTVREAISHLPPVLSGERCARDPEHQAPAHIGRILRLIERIPADGGDRRSLPSHLQLRCHTAVDSGDTPGFTDVYGRLRWDAPAVTITAKSSTPSCGRFIHPEQHRNISVREAAILQGFPQDFRFEGPFVNKYRQIGEAVPPAFARFVAWQLLDHFQAVDQVGTPNFLCSFAKQSTTASDAPLLVDAFCGAGGLSLGFDAAGFETRFAFDADAASVASFNGNLKPVAEVADISTTEISARIAEAVGVDAPYVVIGGPPCQGFSQQRRGGDEDDRNNLVVRFAQVIKQLPRRPAAVVLENVTYLDSPRGKKVFEKYLALIEKLGFVTFRHDLNSAEYGVPQLRRRIIVVAINEKYAANYSGPAPLTPSRWPTIGECLFGLPQDGSVSESVVPNHQPSREGSLNKRRIMFVDMGQGRLSIPDELQLPCHRRYGGHLDVYGRLDWFSQARTITGGFDSFTRGEFAHPFYHRSITPREAARIQGFPDWFEFRGNRAQVRRQIGNAVPPPMAFAIGRAVFNAIIIR